jgi:hypothetical protein
MRRKKQVSEPVWLTWEGEDFPRKFHSDSVVFYISEHIYLDEDVVAKKSLARQIQLEGLSYSLGESLRLIEDSWVTKAGYYFEDGDEDYPVYCEIDDLDIEWDATFVEVPVVC